MTKTFNRLGYAPVNAFACSQCDAAYALAGDASECCRCATCEHKYPRKGFGSECGACVYGSQLREARKAARRGEIALDSARKRLDQLLKMKRPAFGSAVR